jgi:DNA-binding transcriptional ArsR family regulator
MVLGHSRQHTPERLWDRPFPELIQRRLVLLTRFLAPPARKLGLPGTRPTRRTSALRQTGAGTGRSFFLRCPTTLFHGARSETTAMARFANASKFATLFVYALTRICVMEYIQSMESAFEIIAEPNRRAILGLLVSSQQSVGEIERRLRMSQPAVSKHLRVLRDAGFVESTVDAQRRLYRLKPQPFQEVDVWLAQFRKFWSAHVDALERHLDRMEQSTPSRGKPRRRQRGPNRERHKGETK